MLAEIFRKPVVLCGLCLTRSEPVARWIVIGDDVRQSGQLEASSLVRWCQMYGDFALV